MWWNRKALSRAQERQSSVRGCDEAVYIADAGEFRAHASHGFCRIMGFQEEERKRKKKTRNDFHVPSDLLVQGNREPLSGAQQRNRAVLRRAKTPGVVDRRKLGPHAADRLWSYRFYNCGTCASAANGHPEGLAFCYGLYLYRGTGNPCAGHIRTWEPPTSVRKPRMSSVDGIFGRTLPTGSKKHVVLVFASPACNFDIKLPFPSTLPE